MDFTVRRAVPEDFELIRAIRLRALTLEPSAYGSTLEREVAFTDDLWKRRLAPEASPHFVTVDATGTPDGMIVGAVDEDDANVGHIFGMWVDAHARASGAADALVGAVVEWAGAQRCTVLQLHLTEGNDRAERMYMRHGFARTGQSWFRERDGLYEVEMVRSLEP